jgi:hypothetical protein
MRTAFNLVERVRAEYLEMPGLSLTREQVERLCGIERANCQIVLDALIARSFLWMKPDGQYARLTESHSTRNTQDATAPAI